ncbi:MAG: hypothetical protein IOC82_13750 [Aestuariivirga sp.]|uniref:hypothetical protein n=1 Tax=Aestuariivirga sp. TaxID=2650926 RepID=UPI0025C13062|nr:hypothetical protein [Aestuariivirga sp.]MCA3562081.1 hypothetical protein [Aestuariivirga sp.]
MTKKTLTLLFASAALTATIALPAWSALHKAATGETVSPLSTRLGSDDQQRPMMLAEDDDHEKEGGSVSRRGSDDDDEDECEDDDGNCGPAAAAPAPAGSVPPPQNGLFDNSTAPKVQVK